MQFKQKNLSLLSASIAFLLLVYALFSQHIYDYDPCVKCIYQRFSILIIFLASLLSLYKRLFIVGLLTVLITAIYGFIIASTHADVIAGIIDDICQFRPQFGFLGRLDEIAPWFFAATGYCIDDGWRIIGFNMPEWMQFIFLCFAISCICVLCYTIYKKIKNI